MIEINILAKTETEIKIDILVIGTKTNVLIVNEIEIKDAIKTEINQIKTEIKSDIQLVAI